MKRSPWAALPVMLCLLALLWPVQGIALTGVTDGPAGVNLADANTEFRRCDPPLALSFSNGFVRRSTASSTPELLMEQQFEASCNSKKGLRWQICAAVLAVALYRRRRPEEVRVVRTQAVLLAGAVALAAAGVTAARSLDLIYTSGSHILWISVVLYLVADALVVARRRDEVADPDPERVTADRG